MVDEPLLDPAQVLGFPGAPFPAGVVSAAAGQVRDDCGWHIAPEVTETVTLYTDRGTVALLPSLNVVSVSEVRREDGTVIEGWRVRPNGVLSRAHRWPSVIEVDFVHGYRVCPSGLLSVIAERAQRIRGGGVKAESLSGRSVSLETAPGSVTDGVLSKYMLPGRP